MKRRDYTAYLHTGFKNDNQQQQQEMRSEYRTESVLNRWLRNYYSSLTLCNVLCLSV